MLRHLPPGLGDPNVIVGLDTPDDAGVYRIADDVALVQTVDFFTPVVDDGYAFGQIAAANALSDVFAMGARPVTALNIVGFPINKLPASLLADILRGGADKVAEAGAALVGGHSIDDQEPKYGLAVTGLVHPDRLLRKGAARPGDILILTKPIGVGVVTTAIKRTDVDPAVVDEVVQLMGALNDFGARLYDFGVRCATDITGFGLLGHALEIATASGVALEISASSVPILDAARHYGEQGFFPGGSKANRKYVEPSVDFEPGVKELDRALLCDAVTSGGLLIACPPEQVDALQEELERVQTPSQHVIGRVLPGPSGRIRVTA